MSTESFAVAVISPDRSTREMVTGAMEAHPNVDSVWTLSEYPAPGQLTQLRDATSGCVVFLDFADFLRARSIASELDRCYPNAVIVAIQPAKRPQDLLEFMQLGIRELISVSTPPSEIVQACDRASHKLRPIQEEDATGSSLYAFLPARPGSGATTIAAHSSAAAARLSSQPTLLIDFDLRLGMTSFLFKLHGEQSVLDALIFSGQLEHTLWDRVVGRRGPLDILGSAPLEFTGEARETGAALLLDYARQRYSTICVDLPGEMREHELETLTRAREIFLVCTSDLGTLHMAKRKTDFLQTLDVHSRVSVIMNRADGRGSMPVDDVEEILGLPVRFTVPNAEKEITEATRKAEAITGRSSIAGQLEKIARRMVATAGAVESDTKTRRFIEFFSVTPIREKVGSKR